MVVETGRTILDLARQQDQEALFGAVRRIISCIEQIGEEYLNHDDVSGGSYR